MPETNIRKDGHIMVSTTSSTTDPSTSSAGAVPSLQRAHIHDPAIIAENGRFLIMGTHRRYAVSSDLMRWTPLHNNLTDDAPSVLGDAWKAWAYSPANPNLLANTWAPDAIWNPVMGKWCQYLSVNGDHYVSQIVLLTADDPEKDWTYVGPVVYSGFDASTVSKTDVPRVVSDCSAEGLKRYSSLTDTRINAIDASLSWDENDHLWMTFGSWFGGVWMIRLDPTTGLRDYRVKYATVPDVSDAYYGIKLAGGHWVSGEGSYLVKSGEWWYLFLAYGPLQQTGGYQIRLFRSRSITGPYVDEAGNPAIWTHSSSHNWTETRGIRLLSSVAWRASGTQNVHAQGDGSEKLAAIEVSQGHNSVLGPDEKGRLFIVYHTRFADLEPSTRYSNGHDYYESRIRGLLPTADGWLTVAPFEYRGVSSTDSVAHVDGSLIAGTFDVVVHDPTTYFDGSLDDGGNLTGVNKPVSVVVSSDGSLRSQQAERLGSWSADDRSGRLSLTFDHVPTGLALKCGTYEGRLLRLPDDESTPTVRVCFSAIGQNVSIWGAQTTASAR